MKISRNDIKIMTESCLRMLTEISSKDAYTRFYSKLATPEQWEDFMYVAPTMTPIHKAALDAMTYKDCPEEMYHQPFSQGEDRLVSRKKSIPNANRIIRKIDMYIDPYKAGDKHWQDVYGKKLTYLIKNYKDKINFYDDRNKFDRQV